MGFKRGGSKFGNIKQRIGAFTSASKLETSVLFLLHLRERAKEIEIVKIQDSVYLTKARILYIADFKIKDLKTGELQWVEAKGYETDTWRIKRRLWKHYGPGPLHIYKGTHKNPKFFETIIPEEYDPSHEQQP